ncbi:hypothetical protein BDW22DRAFT_1209201 [Trametopsis cervina]|nr:hypothetical protein BDW22DRAFT_1209201 [Trametopsis cervina]
MQHGLIFAAHLLCSRETNLRWEVQERYILWGVSCYPGAITELRSSASSVNSRIYSIEALRFPPPSDTAMSQQGPLYALPNELLVQILREACMHSFPRCCRHQMSDHRNKPTSPLTLSHVSRRLRHITQLLPELWTCIHVTADTVSNGSGSTKLMELVLSYSADLPLFVTFGFEGFPQRKDSFKPLLQLLATHAWRWMTLALYGFNPQAAVMALVRDVLAQSTMPKLHSFILQQKAQTRRDVDFTFTAPNLRQLRLSKTSMDPGSFSINCQHLTHLSFGSINLESWYEVAFLLRSCTDTLQSLVFEASWRSDDIEERRHRGVHEGSPTSLTTPLPFNRVVRG